MVGSNYIGTYLFVGRSAKNTLTILETSTIILGAMDIFI